MAVAAFEGGVGGLSLASTINGTVIKVAIKFCRKMYVANFLYPSGIFSSSFFPIIAAGITSPKIQPIGRASPPSAVERDRSLSPNQVLANLLDELMKNPYPKAAIIVPRNST